MTPEAAAAREALIREAAAWQKAANIVNGYRLMWPFQGEGWRALTVAGTTLENNAKDYREALSALASPAREGREGAEDGGYLSFAETNKRLVDALPDWKKAWPSETALPAPAAPEPSGQRWDNDLQRPVPCEDGPSEFTAAAPPPRADGALLDHVRALPWVEDERHGAGLRFGGAGSYGAGLFFSPELTALYRDVCAALAAMEAR